MDPAGQVAAAPSSYAIPAADKGKDPIVDDSIPVDLLTEQERVLKNLHDYQLREDLAKKLQAEQEEEFARQQEELAQKAQAESDDVNEENMNERLGMLLMRKRRELAEQSQVKPMNKIQQRDFIRDFIKNQSASVDNQGWTMKQAHALRWKHPLLRGLEVPQVPFDSSQVPASVPAALSIVEDVLVSIVSTTTTDVSPAPTLPAESVAEVNDENQTASEQVSAEHTFTCDTREIFKILITTLPSDFSSRTGLF
nr:hypothetical protein [Tanacetum cinerariifolium]